MAYHIYLGGLEFQLRYFKNKDTITAKNKTASELIEMIAGKLTDTGTNDPSHINDWGILQHLEEIRNPATVEVPAPLFPLISIWVTCPATKAGDCKAC